MSVPWTGPLRGGRIGLAEGPVPTAPNLVRLADQAALVRTGHGEDEAYVLVGADDTMTQPWETAWTDQPPAGCLQLVAGGSVGWTRTGCRQAWQTRTSGKLSGCESTTSWFQHCALLFCLASHVLDDLGPPPGSVNCVAKLLARLDRVQRRRPVLGLPVAVVYKFFDDHGNYLSAILTYYAFVSIFPLLLIASSVLGFLLHDNPPLQRELLDSGLSQFPIIGEQLGRPDQLQGSASAITVGALTALYGATGLAQASQHLMQVLWSVPRNSRPNPFVSRLRSLLLLVVSGVAFLCIAAMGAIGMNGRVLGADLHAVVRPLVDVASVLFTAGVFVLLFRLTTAHHHTFREAAPGALTVGLLWQALQVAGSAYVEHVIAKADDMNKTFALVLGLVAVLYIASVMAVLSAEINVVRVRRFYPRALLTPFTDDVDLTEADRRAYAAYAQRQRFKGFEVINVSFDGNHDQERKRAQRAPSDAERPTAPPRSSPHP